MKKIVIAIALAFSLGAIDAATPTDAKGFNNARLHRVLEEGDAAAQLWTGRHRRCRHVLPRLTLVSAASGAH